MKTNVSWPAVTTVYKSPNIYQLSSWSQALIKYLSPSVGKKISLLLGSLYFSKGTETTHSIQKVYRIFEGNKDYRREKK